MRRALLSAIAGAIFAVGLGLAQMTDPRRVIGFLDFTGNWDPTLVFVLAAAVGVYFVVHLVTKRYEKPVMGPYFSLPTSTSLDWRLLGGAALFGIGWGLGGFCPGPAIASVTSGALHVFAFTAAMVLAMALYGVWNGFSRTTTEAER